MHRGGASAGSGSVALAAGSIAVAALALGLAAGGSAAKAGKAPARPNIVVIQTDDQTVDSMQFMDRTREFLGERGATFRICR
jgi:hypothetical protein